ncbi:hypothetical protein MSIMFI_02213 [Mycobacterium simulans]|nr:hypothetical protein MSIMFI_02213 [Mycobacterium simulans]
MRHHRRGRWILLEAALFEDVDESVTTAVLAAMTSVIESLGGKSGRTCGQQLVDATAAVLFGWPIGPGDGGVDGLAAVAPDQLAATIGGRRDVADISAELIAVAALADGQLDTERVTAALTYASHLGVEASWVTDLRDIVEGRLDKAMHDMVVRNAATFPGLAEPGDEPRMQPYDGQSDADKRLYARYQELEGYLPGSFGRALWVHFRRHGFRFPGQDGAFHEAFAIPHDSLHVLSGYDTSMQGELLVSTYTGRMHAQDAFTAHLLPVILEWHIGQEVNGIGAQHGALDPWKFLVAWRRGEQTTTDVLDPGWHFFDVAREPLTELRSRYGIPELPDRYRPTGPEVNVTSEADPTVR